MGFAQGRGKLNIEAAHIYKEHGFGFALADCLEQGLAHVVKEEQRLDYFEDSQDGKVIAIEEQLYPGFFHLRSAGAEDMKVGL